MGHRGTDRGMLRVFIKRGGMSHVKIQRSFLGTGRSPKPNAHPVLIMMLINFSFLNL